MYKPIFWFCYNEAKIIKKCKALTYFLSILFDILLQTNCLRKQKHFIE